MSIPNSARNSKKHTIVRRKDYPHLYVPERILQKIWHPLEGVSLLPSLFAHWDLIHSFNAIPYTDRPWIVTFESILPRTIGTYGNKLSSILINQLNQENCRKIIAMSKYAQKKFIRNNKSHLNAKIIDKLEVIYPNFPLSKKEPKKYKKGDILELIFVGNDFARKGGIVALRVAKKARKIKLPIKIHIISKMNYGRQVYTDCNDASKYKQDIKNIDLDNVKFHRTMPNREVIDLLSKSHIQLMCTLDDTYGYSILEGFSVGTPAITTNVCALPEFVNENNGIIVNLKLNESGNWIHLTNRSKENYWSVLDKTYNNLADQAIENIIQVIDDPDYYEKMSAGAIAQAKAHDSKKANDFFDKLYTKIIRSN
ncbi:MAG: glycosyltransferase family 4 protein [Nostocaceae cyanobacterium]|nr:glycosyltransferase family 4 protein [Nostocaceae cyanobacterium]